MFWQILATALMKVIKRIQKEIQLFKRKLFLGCFQDKGDLSWSSWVVHLVCRSGSFVCGSKAGANTVMPQQFSS